MTTWELTEMTVTCSIRVKLAGEEVVSEEQTLDKTVAYFSVTDAPDMPPYSASSILFRPESVVVEFNGTRLVKAEVSGFRVLKSGQLGATRHDYYATHRRDEWPEWLVKLAEEAEAEMRDV